MNTKASTATNDEWQILRQFFDEISAMKPNDNTISDSKLVRTTGNKLKIALRGSDQRCTCARVTWGGICEVCQASPRELVYLRNFFREIRNAKKNNMPPLHVQEFIENTKKSLVT